MAILHKFLAGVAVAGVVLPSTATIVIDDSESAPSLRGADAPVGCSGEWCGAMQGFAALFDTNEPAKMQQAVDKYSEWDSDKDGIKVSVTASHYYVMYHENVKAVLTRYQGQGYFAWSFSSPFEQPDELNDASHPDEITLVRDGTLTMNLGWGMRGLFWSSVVKGLPSGQVFPYSHVSHFDDCHECSAKMVLNLKKGGLHGDGAEWKIIGFSIVKLA